MIDDSRARPGLLTAPASLAGVRQMMRALRRGETVGLLPDQVPPDGMGVWAQFFGRPAYTMTLAARLIQQTGATPLLMVGERLPRGAGYHVHVLPLPEPLPDGDAGDEAHQRACAAVINRAMERVIRPLAAAVPLGLPPLQGAARGRGGRRCGRARVIARALLAAAVAAAACCRCDCRRRSAAASARCCMRWRARGVASRCATSSCACPSSTSRARRALACEHFQWLGRSLLERGLLWYAPRRAAEAADPRRGRRRLRRAQRRAGDVAGAALHGARRRRRRRAAVPVAAAAPRSTRRRATRCSTRRCAAAGCASATPRSSRAASGHAAGARHQAGRAASSTCPTWTSARATRRSCRSSACRRRRCSRRRRWRARCGMKVQPVVAEMLPGGAGLPRALPAAVGRLADRRRGGRRRGA